jgi:hypothetical protein
MGILNENILSSLISPCQNKLESDKCETSLNNTSFLN